MHLNALSWALRNTDQYNFFFHQNFCIRQLLDGIKILQSIRSNELKCRDEASKAGKLPVVAPELAVPLVPLLALPVPRGPSAMTAWVSLVLGPASPPALVGAAPVETSVGALKVVRPAPALSRLAPVRPASLGPVAQTPWTSGTPGALAVGRWAHVVVGRPTGTIFRGERDQGNGMNKLVTCSFNKHFYCTHPGTSKKQGNKNCRSKERALPLGPCCGIPCIIDCGPGFCPP